MGRVTLLGAGKPGAPLSTLYNGLISYYKLDGNALDAAGNYNATATMIDFSLSNGKIFEGAGANGVDSSIETLSDVTELHGATAFSMYCWVKFDSVGNNQFFLGKWDYLTNGTFGARLVAGGDLQFFICNNLTDTGANLVNTSGLNLATGTWYYLYFEYDGARVGGTNKAKIAVNGVFQATTETGTISNSLTNGTAPFMITFIDGVNSTTSFDQDEVGLWSRVLTPAEIAERYNGGAGMQLFF